MAGHAEYCYKVRCNNNIYREKVNLEQRHVDRNPEEVENLRREIQREDNIPEVLEENEIVLMRQSYDHRGVFNIFEPELKNMIGRYFDALLNYVYTFAT